MTRGFETASSVALRGLTLGLACLGLVACGGKTHGQEDFPQPEEHEPYGPGKFVVPTPDEDDADWWDDGTCLASGTLIQTPEGPRKIETLAPGDYVLSRDDATGELRNNPILSLKASQRAVHRLSLSDGRSLLASGDHLFFDAQSEAYLPLRELAQDASLLSLNAPSLVVRSSEELALASWNLSPLLASAKVFDLSVARDHNYFAEGILVHNKSGAGPCSNVNVAEAIVCQGPGTAHSPESHYGRVAVSTHPRVEGMGGSQGGGDADMLVVAFKPSDDYCEGTLALRLARTTDYGFLEIARSDTPCPESLDELTWQEFPLHEIDAPLSLDVSDAPYVLARYHRYAASCLTAGGYAVDDLCPEQ